MVYGVGPVFLSVDWLIACSDSENGSTSNHHTHHHPVYWPHHLCVPAESSRLRELVFIIGCLYHGSVYCASMPPVPESVPACQRVILKCLCFPGHFPEVPDVLKAKTLCHCARWLKHHKTVLMVQILFVMMIFDCFTLSCDGLLAVFVTINCFKSIYSLFYIVLLD